MSTLYKGITIDHMAGYYRIAFNDGRVFDFQTLHAAKCWITKHCL